VQVATQQQQENRTRGTLEALSSTRNSVIASTGEAPLVAL
jgi:hypothetical protein